MKRPDDPRIDPLLATFFGCAAQIRATLRAFAEARGLARDAFDVVAALGPVEGMTCKALARRVLVPNPTLTRTLARMEADGLVALARGADARQKIASLTPAGRDAYAHVFLPHLALVAASVDHLDAAERAELDRLLRKLAAAFAAEGASHG